MSKDTNMGNTMNPMLQKKDQSTLVINIEEYNALLEQNKALVEALEKVTFWLEHDEPRLSTELRDELKKLRILTTYKGGNA